MVLGLRDDGGEGPQQLNIATWDLPDFFSLGKNWGKRAFRHQDGVMEELTP